MAEKKHIILIAGEASGDLHGAHLVEELKLQNPNLTFSGLGGPQMREAGVDLYFDLTKLAVVGFVEVLKHYSEFKRIFNMTLEKIRTAKPDAVVFIDYPGFNLRLAKEVKKLGITTIYYISPQVWAWKKNRVFAIQRDIDKMIVIFKFEEDFYQRYGIKVSYVGHPLIDAIQDLKPKSEVFQELKLDEFKLTLGLLPGSRLKEIERHMPVMIEAAAYLKARYPMMQFVLVKAPTIDRELLESYVNEVSLPIVIAEQDHYSVVNACDLCVVASGTATLETAILEKPMVVIYKTSFFTWLLAKIFVTIPNIGLVNVVAQKRIVPECVQFAANPTNIAHEIEYIFTDETRIAEIKMELKKMRRQLDQGGASERAASEVLKMIS
jgi:lipid-A-disaccharide synthase